MTLAEYIQKGIIYIVEGYYVGYTKDGISVILGNIGGEEQIEAYLKDHQQADW